MASNLHTYRCRCEGKRADGTPCRKTFFHVTVLSGNTEQKCDRCGHLNRFTFAYIGGYQYINGERAELV